jgi:hypothetical protein
MVYFIEDFPAKNFLKILPGRKHPRMDFTGKTGIRFCAQNRIAIDPDWFYNAILIAIAVSESGSDSEIKIADRLCDQNR